MGRGRRSSRDEGRIGPVWDKGRAG